MDGNLDENKMTAEISPRPCGLSPATWLDDHGDYLYQFALIRVRDSHLAEELVQETLVKGLAGFSRFRGEAAVRTWLTQIIRREISQHFRRSNRFHKHSISGDVEGRDGLEELLTVKLQPAAFQSALERDEFWQVIWGCLEGTPPHLAEAMVLKLANDDLSIADLCAQLGISAANFSVRLFRARLLLRACIEKKWLRPEPGIEGKQVER